MIPAYGALNYGRNTNCIKNLILRRTYGCILNVQRDQIPNLRATDFTDLTEWIPYPIEKLVTKNRKKRKVQVTEKRPCLEAFVPYGRIGTELVAGREVTNVMGKVQAYSKDSREITVYVASCLVDVREVVPWASIEDCLRGEKPVAYSLPTTDPSKIMDVVLTFHVSDIQVSLRCGDELKDYVHGVESGV
jgi:hypothetical protein